MLGNYNIHTDLALEDKERFEEDNVEISGVSVEEFYDEENEIRITEVKILTENGSKVMRKPIGTYVTMEMDEIARPNGTDVIAKYLTQFIKETQKVNSILVVGLGNRDVTPDALGPKVIDSLEVTRHIVREYGKYAFGDKRDHMVSAIAPGVMAQTGMESFEIIKGITETTKPDLVIVVDALAARNTKRLNRTIQITDTGIHPGSGVGNHRNEISMETLGVPVIALGIPTVVSAEIIVYDTIQRFKENVDHDSKHEIIQEMQESIAPHLYGMFVTPKDIDETIEQMGEVVAEGINRMLFT